MSYGDVYVAHVALGASDIQTVKAMLEAEAWPGVSLIIAYSTCIAHGFDMSESMTHQKAAVQSGHWPLYRYQPGEGEARLSRSSSTAPPPGAVRRLRRQRGTVLDAEAQRPYCAARAHGSGPIGRHREVASLRAVGGCRAHPRRFTWLRTPSPKRRTKSE